MYKYINDFTGAIYKTFGEALRDALSDFIKIKACRTTKIFNIKKLEKEN